MEYDNPNEGYPENSPPLVRRKLPLNGLERLAPLVFDDQEESSTHDGPVENTAKASSFMPKNSTNPRITVQRRARKRLGLPLIVFTATKEESIIACPDSGSDDNIMSREIAEKLNLQIKKVQDSSPSTFVLANGRTISAVGEVSLKCAFKQGSPATALIECVFYVFQTLAVPMIMGIQFLYSTETLTKHRDRLVEELVPSTRPLRVCSVGRSKKDVVCRVGNYVGCATADTGSELDLVSPEFAASRAFDVEDMCVELEFADRSTGYTMGMIKTAFSIGHASDIQEFIPRSEEISLEFFILDNLNADILVGTDTIQDLQAFSSHEDCFIPAIPRLGQSDLNIIRYIGAVERGFSKAWEFVKDSITSSGKKQATATNQNHKRKRLEQQDQLLQDQLDNRKRLQFTETGPREGPPRTELPLQSQRDDVGLETLSSTICASTPDHAQNSMPVSAHSVLLPSGPLCQFPESPAHRLPGGRGPFVIVLQESQLNDDIMAMCNQDPDRFNLFLT